MTDNSENKTNQTPQVRPPARPYLALRRHGSDTILVVVDGQKRLSMGVAGKTCSSARARLRQKRKVLARYLRATAAEAQRGHPL
jgi:hypothetical protein